MIKHITGFRVPCPINWSVDNEPLIVRFLRDDTLTDLDPDQEFGVAAYIASRSDASGGLWWLYPVKDLSSKLEAIRREDDQGFRLVIPLQTWSWAELAKVLASKTDIY
jgi:hypothetical protein